MATMNYPESLSGQSVLVLGLGDTGLSVVRWLKRQGARVRVADTRSDPPQREALEREFPDVPFKAGLFEARLFDGVGLVVASPGVPLADPVLAQAIARGVDVAGDVELLARTFNGLSRPPRVVGITGSNGKTTVTTMVGEMVKAAGLKAAVIGNIGTPVLEALNEPSLPEVCVMELSSFQLETTASLQLECATVLNVSEDHLDRYADMAAYQAAKARIFAHCNTRVVNRDDPASLSMAVSGSVSFGLNPPPSSVDWGLLDQGGRRWICRGTEPVMALHELPLAGGHNVANAMAALSLCEALGLPRATSVRALREFQGLPHRVQPVATCNDITFYDDSKGTNVGATVAAINGLGRPVVLIAGGDGKGQDFSPLKPVLAAHGRGLVLIGRDAPRIEAAVAGCGIPLQHAVDMPDAVNRAAGLAQPGDAVMLSPACASFDMFRNYAHRAEVFVAAVQDWVGRQEGAR